jgi:hypothetical protein
MVIVDVAQVQLAHEGVVVAEPAGQRHRQVWDLVAEHPAGQFGQHRAAALPVDQRLDHLTGGHAEHIRGHRVDLDPGVLQRFLQSLDLAGARADELGPVPGEVPQLGDLLDRDVRPAQQTAFEQLGQPGAVGRVFSELRK